MYFEYNRCCHCGQAMYKHGDIEFCSEDCKIRALKPYLHPDWDMKARDDPEYKSLSGSREIELRLPEKYRSRLSIIERLQNELDDTYEAKKQAHIEKALAEYTRRWNDQRDHHNRIEVQKAFDKEQEQSRRQKDKETEQLKKQQEKDAAEEARRERFEQMIRPRPIPDEPFRYEHTHILGPQGSGKTTLLQHIFLEDLKKPNPPAYIVIDPKGLLVERIAKLNVFNPMTGPLRDRLVIVDPAQQPALNMFEQPIKTFSPDQASAVLNQLIEIFGYVFSSADSRLTQRQSIPFSFVVRLVFFMGGDINTLMDILDDNPKKRTFAQDIQRFAAHDPTGTVARFFNQDFYDAEFAGTRKQIKSRLYEILARPELARMFLASQNKLNLFECIQNRKIILVNTGLSYLGPSGSQLLGRYIIAMAMNAVFARYFIPKAQWNPVYLMCDEFQDFADAVNTPKLLRLVREYKMGVIMAHQSMYASELDDAVRTSISTSGVKYAASPEGMDLSYMCRDLRCEKEFLSAQQVNATHVNFACYVRGLGLQHPFTVAIRKGNIDREPQMSPAAFQHVIAANKQRLTAPLKVASSQPLQASRSVAAPKPSVPAKLIAAPPTDPSESGPSW